MKKIITAFLFVSTFVVVTFLLFADAEIYIEKYLSSTSSQWTFVFFSGTFLISDIVIPIPSSLIMILNGKVLGFFWGTLLSTVSGVLSSIIGFGIGRKSEKLVNRFFKTKEIEQAHKFYQKYGKFAIALSRAIPILSETIAVLSGTIQIKYRIFIVYAIVGHIVVSAIYAWLGAFTNNISGYTVTILVVGITLVLSWIISLWVFKTKTPCCN